MAHPKKSFAPKTRMKTTKKIVKKTNPKKAETKKKTYKRTISKKTVKKPIKKTRSKPVTKKKSPVVKKKLIQKTTKIISKSKTTKKFIEHPHSQKLKEVLKDSKIAAIFSAILIIPAFLLGLTLNVADTLFLQLINFIIVAVTLILTIYILRGYYAIADRHRTRFLKIMVYVALTLNVVISVYGTINIFAQEVVSKSTFNFILIFLTALVYCIFGLTLWNIRHLLKGTITALSILYVINGLFYASILLFLLTPLVGIALSILEAVMFHKFYKYY